MSLDVEVHAGAEQLWHAVSDGLVLVGRDGRIVQTNEVFDQLFGYPSGALVGQPIERLVPAEFAEKHSRYRLDYIDEPVRRIMGHGALLNLEGLRLDGSTFPVDISLSSISTSAGQLTLAAVRDVTEQRSAASAVAEANRRRAVAEDHQRIARDLHDNVIQHIFALGLELQSLHGEVVEPAVRQRLDDAVDGIDLVIVKVRQAIFDLQRPAGQLRLRERLVAIAGGMTPALGFDPELRFHGPIQTIDDELGASLESVVREALANVARHAEASSASVTIGVVDDQVAVEVVDDGKGIPSTTTRRSGLANLADRAFDCGGSFELTSAAGAGTTVRWAAPLCSSKAG